MFINYIQPPQPNTKSTKIKKIRNGLPKKPQSPFGHLPLYFTPSELSKPSGYKFSLISVYELKQSVVIRQMKYF